MLLVHYTAQLCLHQRSLLRKSRVAFGQCSARRYLPSCHARRAGHTGRFLLWHSCQPASTSTLALPGSQQHVGTIKQRVC